MGFGLTQYNIEGYRDANILCQIRVYHVVEKSRPDNELTRLRLHTKFRVDLSIALYSIHIRLWSGIIERFFTWISVLAAG